MVFGNKSKTTSKWFNFDLNEYFWEETKADRGFRRKISEIIFVLMTFGNKSKISSKLLSFDVSKYFFRK